MNNINNDLDFDREHLWHPYTSMINPLKVYEVEKCVGTHIILADGTTLIDGMSSWWATIHGYNNKRLNDALKRQMENMSHVMFGGFTHKPAIELGKRLVEITPKGLEKIFYSDSGSVSVEVALKMALQYQYAKGTPQKKYIATFNGGYHGDTWHAMSVCDPIGGMHTLYNNRLTPQLFTPRPEIAFDGKWDNTSLESLETFFEENHHNMAGFILEPIVQGAGGMYFYHPNYLKGVRALCNKFDVLLITDEIATGFGRTGKMFACEWAEITPDIMCVGKAMTAGYMSFAATLTTDVVADTISKKNPHSFMHGPTFMGNALACSVAIENIDMLKENSPLQHIKYIEDLMRKHLEPARKSSKVADVRVLGAIGVIEMKEDVDMEALQELFVKRGVWIRPFGKLVYIMPQYIISDKELKTLTDVMIEITK